MPCAVVPPQLTTEGAGSTARPQCSQVYPSTSVNPGNALTLPQWLWRIPAGGVA